MLIDCDTCTAPASACSGCVMTVLLRGRTGVRAPDGLARKGPGQSEVELDDAERAAIGALAHAGLVPPLRLVRGVGPVEAGWPDDPAESWAAADASQGIA